MNDIYTFIENGLSEYKSLHVADFSDEILEICKNLNSLLNNFSGDDYIVYLENNDYEIQQNIRYLFELLSDKLYLDLSVVFNLLYKYQEQGRIDKDTYRDHYYHSIQCFLLGLTLYAYISLLGFSNEKGKDMEKKNLTAFLFSTFLYHDLGYLYFRKGNDSERINETIKSWLIDIQPCGNKEKNKDVLRIEKIFCKKFEDPIVYFSSRKEELKNIWNNCYNYTDLCILEEKFNIHNKPNDVEKHHSFESAVLLYRFIRTKDLFINSSEIQLPPGSLDVLVNEEKEQFLETIRTILFHDFTMNSKISLKDEFFACLLMLVDEIQNYGRPYQNEIYNNKIVLPNKVGVEKTCDGKLDLVKDEDYVKSLDEVSQKAYAKYDTSEVYNVLLNKIEKKDLDSIFGVENYFGDLI